MVIHALARTALVASALGLLSSGALAQALSGGNHLFVRIFDRGNADRQAARLFLELLDLGGEMHGRARDEPAEYPRCPAGRGASEWGGDAVRPSASVGAEGARVRSGGGRWENG